MKFKSINFNTAEFYPDRTKNIIVGTSDDGRIYLYDLEKDKQKILDNHSDKVRDAMFSNQ